MELINHLFPIAIVEQILRTPLFTTVPEVLRMWWPETSGVYSVRSAYTFIMNNISDNGHLKLNIFCGVYVEKSSQRDLIYVVGTWTGKIFALGVILLRNLHYTFLFIALRLKLVEGVLEF